MRTGCGRTDSRCPFHARGTADAWRLGAQQLETMRRVRGEESRQAPLAVPSQAGTQRRRNEPDRSGGAARFCVHRRRSRRRVVRVLTVTKIGIGTLIGLLSSILVLAAAAGYARGSTQSPFDTVELKTYDWRMSRTARPETARKDIVLVYIDEASIR